MVKSVKKLFAVVGAFLGLISVGLSIFAVWTDRQVAASDLISAVGNHASVVVASLKSGSADWNWMAVLAAGIAVFCSAIATMLGD